MNQNTEFTWEKAQQTVDNAVFQQRGKHLSDLEIVILRGAWDNKTYEDIAETEGYTSSYLSKDVGNKLWTSLSLALGEKVSKKNFRTALQRELKKQSPRSFSLYSTQLSKSSIAETITFPEGSVALDSGFYIERSRLETVCYETVVKSGSLIRIKGSKWMGKTSLVNRILHQGHINEQKIVYLDFEGVERSILKDLDKLLRWLCVMLAIVLNCFV